MSKITRFYKTHTCDHDDETSSSDITVKDLRKILFELSDQYMTISALRYELSKLPDDTEAILAMLMISSGKI